MVQEQKKIHEEIEEEKIRNIKNETEAWKFINKCRRKRIEKINEDIQSEEWRNYFTELLEGTQEKMTLNIKDEERVVKKKEEEIKEITGEELIETLKKLKRNK